MDHKKATFLIAMPSITDSMFEKSVVLLSENEKEGDLGLIVNRATDAFVHNVLTTVGVGYEGLPDLSIMFGGPVRADFLWALHADTFACEKTIPFNPQLFLSPLESLLSDLSRGKNIQVHQVGVGYSGWSSQQLEHEIEEGSWWKEKLDYTKLYNTPSENRWHEALDELGVHSDELIDQGDSSHPTIN